MDLKQLVDRGQAARELLNNPTFQGVANELFTLWGAQMFSTDPKDDDGRRVIHAQHIALQTILGVLAQRVEQGATALAILENDENTED